MARKGKKKGKYQSDKKGDKKVTKNGDEYSELQNSSLEKSPKKVNEKVNHRKSHWKSLKKTWAPICFWRRHPSLRLTDDHRFAHLVVILVIDRFPIVISFEVPCSMTPPE